MSSTSTPIPAHRFAEAIVDLPLLNLHFKAAEIRNSISHLDSSNKQMHSYAMEGDRDCADAIKENEETMRRQAERIQLLKQEVERRGFGWGEDVDLNRSAMETDRTVDSSRRAEGEIVSRPVNEATGEQPVSLGGRLGDEDLERRLMERTDVDNEGGDDGVHL